MYDKSTKHGIYIFFYLFTFNINSRILQKLEYSVSFVIIITTSFCLSTHTKIKNNFV